MPHKLNWVRRWIVLRSLEIIGKHSREGFSDRGKKEIYRVWKKRIKAGKAPLIGKFHGIDAQT